MEYKFKQSILLLNKKSIHLGRLKKYPLHYTMKSSDRKFLKKYITDMEKTNF